MKTSPSTAASRLLRSFFLAFALGLLTLSAARAGLNFELHIYQYGSQNNYTYYFDPQLRTNSTGANVSFGSYAVASFGIPTNGSSSFWQYDVNGFNQTDGDRNSYGDFNSMVHEITNNVWSLFITNATMTNVYHFKVALNISSNDLPKVLITAPLDGVVDVTNQPTFIWQGPANYSSLVVSEFNTSQSLPASQTSWLSTRVLYQGPNNFNVDYVSNSITAAVASIPTNSLGQTFSGWVSTNVLEVSYNCQFSVGLPDTSDSAPVLVAHYPFDATSGSVLSAAMDTSGNGLNMTAGGTFGSQGGDSLTSDSAAGIGALLLQDGNNSSGAYLGWTEPTPPALLSALAGSFSVSCWIKTTQNIAWNTAPAYYGAGIVSADNFGLANDVVPIALTGGSIAFNTGGSEDVTLNSVASVNDGNYHHIVVTRNQITGQKIIYIDGQFDSFSSGTTNLLGDPQKLTIGALANAGNPDPNDGSYYQGFAGEVDDLQIYSGVLSSNQVSQLFASPGSTVANNGAGSDQGHLIVARYDFEDTNSPGVDSSGHDNNTYCGGGDGTNLDTFSTAAEVGSYSRHFLGDTFVCFQPPTDSFNHLSNVLSGSFSVSAWVKTTQSFNSTNANADAGAGLFFANGANTNSTMPLALTGGKVAIGVNDHNGVNITLHSQTSVSDGQYHHIAVTRNQASGLLKVYVDGNLEGSTNGSTDLLYVNSNITLGGYFNRYIGLLDDVQIYSGVLSDSEVAELYNTPGTTVPDVSGNSHEFNTALGTTNLNWSTSGDTSWFVENTNTYNGSPAAAQSGSVTNNQSSTLSVTVTGPGTLTFYWSSQDNDPNQGMDYEFYIDDPNTGDIADLYGGGNDWQSIKDSTFDGGPVIIPAGQHTLYWTVYAYGDADPNMAGFLDNVVFTPPDTNPISANITLNIYREQNPDFGEIFIAFPSFNSITPAGTGTTTNTILSPSGYFSTHADQGGGGSSSAILFSLDSMLNECTNGLWSLYINYGLPNQRQFQFSVAINGLTTNLLSAVKLIAPINGATGFQSTAAIQWLGPTNYTSLNVSKQNIDASGYVSTALPVTATSWTPGLIAGTNQCNISYASNNFPGVSFSVPVDSVDSQTAAVWSAQMNLNTTATAIFVVNAGASRVTLLNPKNSGGNFQFSFLSQSGFTNIIQYRTNLTVGTWQAYTNIPGDGTSKTNSIPLSLFSPSMTGFIRVSTQ